ncbi:hypothetical protein [Metabacillus sediminilitoris]|jgi:hypothetical protein|uniref:Uncharacterized protein n=2 Tax=Metabacillus sediminilitoris TaxID=2567941 RepID=A0A4S4BNM6_9BACI|nr:hypothetical protein [Metabacillus sediminilitoris]QGQ45109.1 hypothetical protein GMB29_07435 [Metabacillus sediminilitoris]THF76476.1 hypothetical protein E6W99_21375 [Metabacillus sediminilitoris]
MIKFLLRKSVKPLYIGNQLIESTPYLAIVVPKYSRYQRDEFLSEFTSIAYSHGLIKRKKPIHVNYWYDGPHGNMGLRLWEDGAYHHAKNGVIGISRLNIHPDIDPNLLFDIVKSAVKTLLDNNNIVFFLPAEHEENYVEFYQDLFPEAKKFII